MPVRLLSSSAVTAVMGMYRRNHCPIPVSLVLLLLIGSCFALVSNAALHYTYRTERNRLGG